MQIPELGVCVEARETNREPITVMVPPSVYRRWKTFCADLKVVDSKSRPQNLLREAIVLIMDEYGAKVQRAAEDRRAEDAGGELPRGA